MPTPPCRDVIDHVVENTLLDRTVIEVTAAAYAAFVARLNEPPRANERLRRAIQTTPPWE